MAQLLSFSSLAVPAGLALIFRGSADEPVDPELRNLGHITGPEAPLRIEFVGLNEEQQRRALAGFPGGNRFSLVTPPKPQ